jgi:hypothetical protein
MNFFKKLFTQFKRKPKTEQKSMDNIDYNKIARHEAAHGIVWYLFKKNWIVNQITIERDNLPDATMNGALHITANFNVNKEMSLERANEIFAISLAGIIGQNINAIDDYILLRIQQVQKYEEIFDMSGCGGDIEIANKYLPYLGNSFQVSKARFTQIKLMDLASLFQDYKVQQLHQELTNLLLEKRTILRQEIIDFFDDRNFQERIEMENLDISFYHQAKD